MQKAEIVTEICYLADLCDKAKKGLEQLLNKGGLLKLLTELRYKAVASEIERVTDLYYLRLLLSAPGEVPSEQLLAAHVREGYRQRGEDREWLERAAREIATLLKHD